MNSVNSITGCLAQKSLVLDDASSDPGSPALVVGFGQGTFDAEGSEQPGPYFSRTIHWPGGASGVTIGRGYDMGSRTQAQVVRELISAGMDTCDAQRLSQAAGLRGQGAQLFFGDSQWPNVGHGVTSWWGEMRSLVLRLHLPSIIH